MHNRRFQMAAPLLLGALLLAPASARGKAEYEEIEIPAEAPRKSTDLEFPIFYPPPPDIPRIQWLRSYATNLDVEAEPNWFEEWIMGTPEVTDMLQKPWGIDIHGGQILVSDTSRNMVMIFDLADEEIEYLGDAGQGALAKPIHIRTDAEGNHYVVDTILRGIMVYNEDNRFIKAYGPGLDLQRAVDVAITDSEVHVLDLEAGQIVVLDKETGKEKRRVSRTGKEEADLYKPNSFVIDKDGNYVISDNLHYRAVKLSPEGEHLQTYGTIGDSYGQFQRPRGIAVDRENRVWVVDSMHPNIQVFNDKGQLLTFIGAFGNAPGNFILPADITIDYDHNEYFADLVEPGYELKFIIGVTGQFGMNRVNIYGFIEPLPGTKPPKARQSKDRPADPSGRPEGESTESEEPSEE